MSARHPIVHWTLALTAALLWCGRIGGGSAQSQESHWSIEAMGETMAAPDNKENFKQNLLNYVFHANGPVKGIRPRQVPMVMDKIYDVVADRLSGQTRRRLAFDVDIIRGLEDSWASDRRMQFLFDMRSINASTDEIVGAQFHIFKKKPFHEEIRREHFVRVSLYKILDESNLYNRNGTVNTASGAVLLETRQVSALTSEWIIFESSSALKNAAVGWIKDPSSNKGFLLTATDLYDRHVNGTRIEFVQRYETPHGRQPVFVVYSNEDKPVTDVGKGEAKEGYQHVTMYLNEDTRCLYGSTSRDEYDRCMTLTRRTRRDASRDDDDDDRYAETSRSRRAVANDGHSAQADEAASSRAEPTVRHRRSKKLAKAQSVSDDFELPNEHQYCRKESLYVSFDALGWGKWIVAPEGIHASQCNGRCPFPLSRALAATNHAVLKSVSNYYKPNEVRPPCCVPEQLGKMSILYHESDSVVTMRTYDGMMVLSCGCR